MWLPATAGGATCGRFSLGLRSLARNTGLQYLSSWGPNTSISTRSVLALHRGPLFFPLLCTEYLRFFDRLVSSEGPGDNDIATHVSADPHHCHPSISIDVL